jgi:hypothetical protein
LVTALTLEVRVEANQGDISQIQRVEHPFDLDDLVDDCQCLAGRLDFHVLLWR